MTRDKRITLREIKDILNKVEDKYLDKPLVVMGEERGFLIDDFEILQENWYVMAEEYLTPESELHNWEPQDGEEPSEKELAYEKGEAVAHIDYSWPKEDLKRALDQVDHDDGQSFEDFMKELDNKLKNENN